MSSSQQNRHRSPFFSKIIYKFGALFILILFFITFSLGLMFYVQSFQETDAIAIDVAGRNRMLSQRIGFYSEQIVDGNEDARDVLEEIIDLHDRSFYAMKNGGVLEGTRLPTVPKASLDVIYNVESLWVEYRDNAKVILNENVIFNKKINPLVDNALTFIELNGPDMLQRNDAIVKVYVEWNNNKRQLFNLVLVILLIINFLIIGFAFILVRSFSKPISELRNVAKGMMEGNFSVKSNIHTGDEFEELGEAFNNTADALNALKMERNQLESAKTRFLSITSHELRSPMTPMKAQLQMNIKGYFGRNNKEQKESLDVVLRNLNRLDIIVGDFLDVSRIEAARLKFNFVKTSLKETSLSIINDMYGFMPEKDIKLINKIPKLPVIEVDPDRFGQVLRNLINNAIKFSKNKGTIIIKAKPEKSHILFSVIDKGIGISDKNIMRVFEPFFQAEQTIYRERGGTGLGLAICKGIIESQLGKIWVESKTGKGTTFNFTIPFKPVRNLTPIKLLFSPMSLLELQLKETFNKLMGPIGTIEFNELRKRGDLSKNNAYQYIDSLVKEGILEKSKGQTFKENIKHIYSGEHSLKNIIKTKKK